MYRLPRDTYERVENDQRLEEDSTVKNVPAGVTRKLLQKATNPANSWWQQPAHAAHEHQRPIEQEDIYMEYEALNPGRMLNHQNCVKLEGSPGWSEERDIRQFSNVR